MKKIIIIALIVVIAAGSFFIYKKTKKNKHAKAQTVKTVVVEKGTILIKLEETGEIQPVREIEIKSEISGKVLKFFADAGDFVQKGDIIAEIQADYDQARTISSVKSGLKLAEIRLKNARKEFEDSDKLYKENYISQKELDDSRDALEEAKISFQSAQQQYDSIKDIDTDSDMTKIVSPASGTIIERLIEEGEKVVSSAGSFSEGTIIARLADISQMIVKSKINEVDISKIHKGQEVEIQVDAYPYEKYSGSITKIAAMATISNNVKVFPFEIKIDKSDTRLKTGMTANITIIGEKKDSILVVPIRSIFADKEGQDIVYLVENDTISISKIVKTGINDFQQVEIIQGLSEGDKISLSEPEKKNEEEGEGEKRN